MSPYEVAAREKKAVAIAEYLAPQIDFTRIDATRALRSLSQALRNEIARRAAQYKPSPDTWSRVIELVEAERDRRADAVCDCGVCSECDPFVGIGEEAYGIQW